MAISLVDTLLTGLLLWRAVSSRPLPPASARRYMAVCSGHDRDFGHVDHPDSARQDDTGEGPSAGCVRLLQPRLARGGGTFLSDRSGLRCVFPALFATCGEERYPRIGAPLPSWLPVDVRIDITPRCRLDAILIRPVAHMDAGSLNRRKQPSDAEPAGGGNRA